MKSSKGNAMKLTNYFDISRFWLLLRLELYRSRKAILMTIVISLGLLYFLGLLMSPVFEPTLFVFKHTEGFAFHLLIGGFVLSSLTFNDLNNTLRRYHYLTLPVSTLEKFLCMWLLTSVGWILVYTIIYSLYTMVANLTGQMLFSDMTFIPFDPFGEFSLTTIRYYFVTQGIFLVGATHFKGYVFPKTLFTLILFAFTLGMIAYFLLGNVMNADTEQCVADSDVLEGTLIHQLWQVLVWAFWWLLAPLCWVVTYLGLKEKEV